jgi:hypothetical protein|tara:strand:+ start:226 stop:471 length:246 start_codon:yes stop_codon:yes gene_type:complete
MVKHDGVYCKQCGLDIRLNEEVGSNQSIKYNQEKEILYCQECKPRKESKYNQPYRRFWVKSNHQWANLKRKGTTTNWRQKD